MTPPPSPQEAKMRTLSDERLRGRKRGAMCGEKNPNAKLTAAQIEEIRASKRSTGELVKQYGVGPSHIWRIRGAQIRIQPKAADDPSNPALAGEWRPIEGYEGRYDVSTDGRIRSWDAKMDAKSGFMPCLMVPQKNKLGYFTVNLTKDQKAKTAHVHHLVAAAFIGPRPDGLLVLHGDGDKANNSQGNLRYGTHQDNYQDAVRHGTRKVRVCDVI